MKPPPVAAAAAVAGGAVTIAITISVTNIIPKNPTNMPAAISLFSMI